MVTDVMYHSGSSIAVAGHPNAKLLKVEHSSTNWVNVFALLSRLGLIWKVVVLRSKKPSATLFSLARMMKDPSTRRRSRPTTMTDTGQGSSPDAVRPTAIDPMNILSARGSRNAPRVVCKNAL